MISITIDQDIEAQLEALGATTESSKIALVLEKLRKAFAVDGDSRRRESIAEQYRRAYSEDGGLGEEFEGWGSQGVCPPSSASLRA